MNWILGTLTLLLIGFVFQLSLLVYSMYLLAGILLITRTLSSLWIRGLKVTRKIIRLAQGLLGGIVERVGANRPVR